MPNKIFDIFPPEEAKNYVSPAQKKPEFKEQIKQEWPEGLKERPSFRFFLPKGLILAFTILIFAGVFIHLAFARADILIWPATENVKFKEKVAVDSNVSKMDIDKKIIQGQAFEIEEELSEDFPASGKKLKEEKAKGIIKVFNNYSTSSQILIATTRFIADNGKLFRSTERVVVPGQKYEKGKLQPGEADVKVEAASVGDDYNIGPSTFSLPGLAGTAKYTAFYGKSYSPMAGGFTGEVPVVLQEDLDNAKNILEQRIKEELKRTLLSKISEDFILAEEALFQKIIDRRSSVGAGTETQKFKVTVKASEKGLAFRKSDLEKFAKEFMNSRISSDKKIHQESIKINYNFDSVDLESNKISLDLEFSAAIFKNYDPAVLKKSVLGKSLGDAKAALESYPEINKATLQTFPFWVKSVPQAEERVKVKLNIE